MTFDQDILLLSQDFAKRTNARPDRAILGDENGVIVDPQLPLTNVLVRQQTSNGLSVGRSVILPADLNIRLTPGLPVLLGYDHNYNPIILRADTQAAAATGVASVTSVGQNTSTRVQQGSVETLNIVAGGGLTVNLKGWNVIADGVYYEFSITGIDLSSFVPSSGLMCYAAIFVLSDLSGVEVFASTPVPTTDIPLGASDVNECLVQANPTSTPAWAVKLVGGLFSFDQTYLDGNTKDLRQLVNSTGGVTGARAATIVTKTSNYTATNNNYTILVDATGGNVTITLPAAALAYNSVTGVGQVLNIKKIDSSGNSVTIDGNGAETIDGATTVATTTQWTSYTLQSNGTAWFIL